MRVVVLFLTLVAMLGHAWLSHELKRGDVEAALRDSLALELANEPQFKGVEVEYEYLDGILKGELPTREMKDLAEAFSEDFRLAGRISRRDPVGPAAGSASSLMVEFDGGRFRMTGKLPDEFTSLAVEDELRLLDQGEVSNEVEISNRVIRPEWDGMTNFLFEDFFHDQGNARIVISDDEVRLKRKFEGGDEERKKLLSAADQLQKLGLKVVDELEVLRSEPVELLANLDGGMVKLSGRLGDEGEKETLLQGLGEALAEGDSGVAIDPRVLPASWSGELAGILRALAGEVSQGRLQVSKNRVELAGGLPASKGLGNWNQRVQRAFGDDFEVLNGLRLVPDLEPTLRVTAATKKARMEGALPMGDLGDGLASAVREAGYEELEAQIDRKEAVKQPVWAEGMESLLTSLLTQARKTESPARLEIGPGRLEVAGLVEDEAQKQSLLGQAKAVLPSEWTLDFEVELKPADSALIAGKVEPGGASMRGVLPEGAVWEEIEQFANGWDGKLSNRLKADDRVAAPAWKGELRPFLDLFFGEVQEGSFELGDKGWVMTGSISSMEAKQNVLAAAESFTGADVSLRDGLRVMAPAEKFRFVAARESKGWVLEGELPNNDARLAMRTASLKRPRKRNRRKF